MVPVPVRRGPGVRGVIFSLLVVALLAVASAAAAQPAPQPARSPDAYRNPVSAGFADTFADPSVIRGQDGYWYAYGTADPLREGPGEPRRLLPIAKSLDLTGWTYASDVFQLETWPAWVSPTASFWAPDIRYFNGLYHLYYTATDTVFTTAASDTAIGVATAVSPTGPWTDSGGPVVGPRAAPGGAFLATLDPAVFTDVDGTRYLYYGSFSGGVWVNELSEDGTRVVGSATRVTIGNRYEAPFLVRRDDYYYLFVSAGHCCAGPTSGYSVLVGRARSVRGPFLDREGEPLDQPRVGGSLVLTPNGNRWVGTGHNAVLPDLAGQDWFLYHGIDRADPFLNQPFGINQRPLLVDRLDWVDDWPVVRAGAGASDDEIAAPTTTPLLGSSFEGGEGLADWQQVGGSWSALAEDGYGYARQAEPSCAPSYLLGPGTAPAPVRVGAALRQDPASGGATGLVAGWRGPDDHVTAWLDGQRGELVVQAVVAGRLAAEQREALPAGVLVGWHRLTMELRVGGVAVELSESGLHDAVAELSLSLPPAIDGSGAVGAASRCGPSDIDELTAAAVRSTDHGEPRVSPLGPVDPAHSDDFDNPEPHPTWTWVRAAAGHVANGDLVWPTQVGDLLGGRNEPSVLLRDMPTGNYVVETKLTVDLGEWAGRNYQQAGLVVYADDDLFARLTQVAIGDTRQIEFGKEQRFAARTSFGGMVLEAAQPTVWLRVIHQLDPRNGEHEFRAALSRDGQQWLSGGVWTLPTEVTPRVGLVAHGAAAGAPPATARFDYFHVHSLTPTAIADQV